MNGPLVLTIVALLYLILSAMVMDLLMELISHLLQSRASANQEDDWDTPHPISPQDEQVREVPCALEPDMQQDDSPRSPPASRPPGPIPISAWLFPPSDYALGVIAISRTQHPAILPARSGPFLYLISRRPFVKNS